MSSFHLEWPLSVTMFKKISLSLLVLSLIIVPSFVFAQDSFGIGSAAQGTNLIGSGTSVNAAQTLPELIGRMVAILLSFIGIIFFILVLYAGITWMTAFGNSEKVDKAKSILEHAAIGLAIVLAAYAISTFVFSSLVNLTNNNNNQSSEFPTQAECAPLTSEETCSAAGCLWFGSQNPPCNNGL